MNPSDWSDSGMNKKGVSPHTLVRDSFCSCSYPATLYSHKFRETRLKETSDDQLAGPRQALLHLGQS